MTYLVNKTDGTAITILDGTANVTATSLTLIGKLATNYGEKQNENFLWLLENFAYSTSPAYPTKGQLWYDTTTKNIKVYDGSSWLSVGSNIVGNVSLTGNLSIGSNGFKIQDLGNVTITNNTSDGNISFYANVGGTNTRVLYIKGSDGSLEVNANAVSSLGVTTKVYVDSSVQNSGHTLTTAMLANVNAANLATITANVGMKSYVDAATTLLYANAATQANELTVANAAIVTANTNLKNYVDNQITTANTNVKNYAVDYANSLNLAMVANITATNASIITSNLAMKSYVDTLSGSVSTDLNTKANINSPTLTGVPAAPTATFGANTTQIATTQYVMTRAVFWDGSRKFVSTSDPSSTDGENGDFWFKYTP